MFQNLIHKGMKENIVTIPHPVTYQSPKTLEPIPLLVFATCKLPSEGNNFQAEGVRFTNNDNNI